MNEKVRATLWAEAARESITVLEDFVPRLDAYIRRHFSQASDQETCIVETYLSQAALRIAKLEHKRVVEGEDFKAAVWWFHQPQHPDDPCAEAGRRALQFEGERRGKGREKRFIFGPVERGLLSDGFAKQLDERSRESEPLGQ